MHADSRLHRQPTDAPACRFQKVLNLDRLCAASASIAAAAAAAAGGAADTATGDEEQEGPAQGQGAARNCSDAGMRRALRPTASIVNLATKICSTLEYVNPRIKSRIQL